jgi:hypothetical protein
MPSRAHLLGVGERVGAAVVVDGDETLLDVDVGRAILAHRPELDQVAVRHELLDRKHHVDVADHVVVLREHRALAINHGVGGGPLLAEVHDRVGAEGGDGLRQELPVADVADLQVNVAPADLAPPARRARGVGLGRCEGRGGQGQGRCRAGGGGAGWEPRPRGGPTAAPAGAGGSAAAALPRRPPLGRAALQASSPLATPAPHRPPPKARATHLRTRSWMVAIGVSVSRPRVRSNWRRHRLSTMETS